MSDTQNPRNLHIQSENQEEAERPLQRQAQQNKTLSFPFTFDWVRIGIFSSVLLILLIGLIYNLFATSEKDIPDEVFDKLYKVLQSQSNYIFAPISESPTHNTESVNNKTLLSSIKWTMFPVN